MDFLSIFCSTRFGDPNSAWQMQQKLKEKNEMYKFVDLRMGGSLIEAVSVSPVCPESACRASASVDNILPTTAMSAISLRFQSVRSVSVPEIDPRSACHSINSAGSTDPHPVFAAHSECNSPEFLSTEDLEPDPGVGRVKRIARDELVNYLYKGKSAWITTLDYKEWLHIVEDNIQGECKSDVKAWGRFGRVEYKEDAFNRFEPHQACWNLTKRGWMGETPFLLCYFMNTSEHLKVARVLLAEFPEMVLDVYEGREYFGQSALHIVIANGDLESVKLLVQCGADIKQRATGRFFRPDDQKDNPDGDTNYKGSAYYGEYPLAFAASRGDIAIYDFLLENGAEPNMKDSFGNTVLHMAVIHDQPHMFCHAVENCDKPACLSLKNKHNLTPLTLACRMGRARMFRLILDLCSVEHWRFGDITCFLYPLATLDSIDANGKINWQSALCYIVKGRTDGHLEMLEGAVVQQLLKEKEETYAKKMFILRLAWAVLHLIFLSIAVHLRPAGDKLLHYNGGADWLRLLCELVVFVSCLMKLFEALLELHHQGLRGFLKNCLHARTHAVYLISCVLVMLCLIFRCTRMHVAEDVLLMFAVLGSWFFLLFFARGFERTGPFVVIISQMCTEDLFRFLVIYFIFLVGFTSGFCFIFRDVNSTDADVVRYHTFDEVILNLFQMTLGQFKYEAFAASHYPVLAKLVFVVFMILMFLLLLQMLIAMMGNTYKTVIMRATKEWQRQWANTVLVLECTSCSTKSRKKYQEQYSRVPSALARPRFHYSQESETDARTLMVVSSDSEPTAAFCPLGTSKSITSTFAWSVRQTVPLRPTASGRY